LAKKNKQDLHRERHKNLKSLGLISGRLKKDYSSAEKHRLYRLDKAYGALGKIKTKNKKQMNGAIHTVTTKKLKNKSEAIKFRKAGHTVYKNTLIIQHDVKDKFSVRTNAKAKSGVSKGERITLLVSKRKLKSGKFLVREELIVNNVRMLSYLEDDAQGKLPRGVRVTGKIGSNSPFSKAVFPDKKQLDKYISNWTPKDTKKLKTAKQVNELRDELVGNMTVVFITK
jgi:hypothetical protein